MDQKQLEQQIETYKQLGKENPNIDVASLVMNAFQTSAGEHNFLSKKEKRWGFLVSIGLPPIGLFFALRFYLSGKSDGKNAAWICIALTVISIVAFVLLFQVTLSSSGTNLQQIEQINPSQVQQLISP